MWFSVYYVYQYISSTIDAHDKDHMDFLDPAYRELSSLEVPWSGLAKQQPT